MALATRFQVTGVLTFFTFYAYLNRICTSVVADPMSKEFNWSNSEKGAFLSSFFYGYAITQVHLFGSAPQFEQLPGGYASTHWGGRIVLGSCLLGAMVAAGLLPVLATAGGLGGAIAIRVVLGLLQAPLLGKWVKPTERSLCFGFIDNGAALATCASLAVTPVVISHLGWRGALYLYAGAPGVVLVILAGIVVYSSPREHPGISQSEVRAIEEAQRKLLPPGSGPNSKIITPWVKIFKSPAVWAIVVNNFTANWSFYTLLTFLPQFVEQELGLNFAGAGALSQLPFWGQIVGQYLFAFIADSLVRRRVSVLTVRRVMMTICSLLPAAALCGVTRVSSRSGAVSLLVLTQFCFGANASGPVSNRLDVAPRLSGVVTGISNSFGSLPGILAPLMIGLVLDSGHCPAPGSHAPAKPSCTSAWDVVWFSAAGFFVLGWISFMAMGRADPHIHPTEVVILRDELCINDEDGEDEDSFLLPKH